MSKQNKAVASEFELLVSFTAETCVLVEAKPPHSETLKAVLTGCTMECECVWRNPGLGFTTLDYSYTIGWLDKRMAERHGKQLTLLPQ